MKINRDFDRFRHVTGRIYSSSFSVGQIGDMIIKTICRKSTVFYISQIVNQFKNLFLQVESEEKVFDPLHP